MLLLEANRVVSVDRLVEALWDDEPPPTAKSQVQISVSALRRLLMRPDGPHVIETRSPGYLIQVADEALDLRRFELLAAKGKAEAAEAPADAVQHLRTALALWRGPAAMGIESRVVQAAAARLNETRMAVLEDCLDLELQLGRHHALIGELTELISTYPLRERLRAQLMLALYRSSRQAEALEAFRAARATLQQELGLDPGEELRKLERAILANDPSLDLPEAGWPGVPRGRSAAVPVPRQLPSAVADFTGREELLARICGLLAPLDDGDHSRNIPIMNLTGNGGIGKTTLALRAAHLLRDSYPDGQLFAQLHGGDEQPTSPSGLLEQFLRSFGIAPTALPTSLDERAAMYRSWLAERRVLIVLDDAASIGQVTPLLPGGARCAVIITSRTRLSGLAGAHQFEVGAFAERSGMELLSRVIGAERVAAEEDTARTLIGLCDRLPLALRVAAAKLAARPHWRLKEMVRRLGDEKRRLDELDLDGASVRATLSFSYGNLDGDCRLLFRRLGLLGAVDFASWVGAPLLDIGIEVAEDLLESLVDARLVEARMTADGLVRYQLHDLVRIYAIERVMAEEPAANRDSCLRRLLGCWLALADEAHRREYGGDFSILHGTAERWPLPSEVVDVLLRDPPDWFQSEHKALVSAILRAGRAGLEEICWDLAMTSVTLFESRAHIDDWRDTHDAALAAVRAVGNLRGEAAMLYSLGILALAGDLADATLLLGQSLELFEQLDDTHGAALARGGLAFVDRLNGRYNEALARYEEALQGFQQVGDLIGEAHMLKDVAQILKDRHRFDLAEQLLDRALEVCRGLGARRVTAQIEYELAELYVRRGQPGRAERSFEAARSIATEAGDIVGQAYAHLGLGIARGERGDFARAEADLAAALDWANGIGDLLLRGRVLLALAELELSRDRASRATARLDEALSVLSDLGSAAVWRARALELAGRVHERAGRMAAAAEIWRAAMSLAENTDPLLVDRLARALDRGDQGQDEKMPAD